MAPVPGSIHRQPRRDSGPARLWTWARQSGASWTCEDAATDCAISARRCRMIVAALHEAGIVGKVTPARNATKGAPSAWKLTAIGRALTRPPIMIVDRDTGLITGVRAAGDTDGTDMLRDAIAASGLTGRAAARALGVHDSTLRKMLRGEPGLASDDPIIARARALA